MDNGDTVNKATPLPENHALFARSDLADSGVQPEVFSKWPGTGSLYPHQATLYPQPMPVSVAPRWQMPLAAEHHRGYRSERALSKPSVAQKISPEES